MTSLPGDKSLAHRALILAALADSPSRIAHVPDGDDVRHTAAALASLGTAIAPSRDAAVLQVAPRPWRDPPAPLDCGNSGTLARLLLGALTGEGVRATLVGDASLSARPMRRVADPLRALFHAADVAGDVVTLSDAGTLPAHTRGPVAAALARPRAAVVDVHTHVRSAQVKSALLLAARRIAGVVRVHEPAPTRDHTERMLAALAPGRVVVVAHREGAAEEEVVELRGPLAWSGFDVALPGDPSSAALLASYAVARGVPFAADDVLVNPRRLGFFRALARMGAVVDVRPARVMLGEPCGAIAVRATGVARGVDVDDAGDLIDEVPALFAVALFARGVTRFRDIRELRVKESDRVLLLAELARAFGAEARFDDDVLEVRGALVARGGSRGGAAVVRVRTDGDHRIAMAAHVVARAAGVGVELDAPGCERTSFPGFLTALDAIA